MTAGTPAGAIPPAQQVDEHEPPVTVYEVRICDQCYALEGEMCHNPECVFCRRTMREVGAYLDALLIRPLVDGERLDLHPKSAAPAGGIVAPQPQFPIPLNEAQETAAKEWAADDRLWTTQETVEFNLRTFARVILEVAALADRLARPQLLETEEDAARGGTMGDPKDSRTASQLRVIRAFVEEHIDHATMKQGDEFQRGWHSAMHNVRNKILECESRSPDGDGQGATVSAQAPVMTAGSEPADSPQSAAGLTLRGRLQPYLRHKPSCEILERPLGGWAAWAKPTCSCGLDRALAEPQEQG